MNVEPHEVTWQPLPWVRDRLDLGRLAALLLLLVTLVGPWTVSADGVPPAEWCGDPYMLLENGRCVRWVPGSEILFWTVGGFFAITVALVTGQADLVERARELAFSFLFTASTLTLVLSFFSTLSLVLRGERRRRQVFHVIAWGLAAIIGVLCVLSSGSYGGLWGIWLYLGITAGMFALELVALLASRRSG